MAIEGSPSRVSRQPPEALLTINVPSAGVSFEVKPDAGLSTLQPLESERKVDVCGWTAICHSIDQRVKQSNI